MMTTKNKEESLIRDIDSLIPRPDIALKVVSMAHSRDCSVKELASTIEHDPSLTANILRIANSAYFGHMKQINSVSDIIVRLGTESIKMLAITGAAVGFLKTPQEAYNLEVNYLWRHSYAAALLASSICEITNYDKVSEVYSAALLHDLGKVILNKILQEKCHEKNRVWDHESGAQLETELIGTNHALVGAALLEKWGLSANLVKPVRLHHSKTVLSGSDTSCIIVYLANRLAESFGISAIDPDSFQDTISQKSIEDDLAHLPVLAENLETLIENFFQRFHQQ